MGKVKNMLPNFYVLKILVFLEPYNRLIIILDLLGTYLCFAKYAIIR